MRPGGRRLRGKICSLKSEICNYFEFAEKDTEVYAKL